MRRDVLLLEEMIQAAVQAVALVEGVTVEAWLQIGSAVTRCCGTSPCSAKPLHSCRTS